MSKERIEYFDFLRGIAIICVVAIHTFVAFEIDQSNLLSYHLAIIWRQIIGFAVPLFLAVSGYFMSNKLLNTNREYLTFLKKQLPRVYIPMIIWSLPILLLSIYKHGFAIKPIIYFFIGGFSVYYFIPLIMQYYILIPTMQKGFNKMGGGKMVVISALTSMASLIVIFYLTKILDIALPLILYAGPFPVWALFFVIGIYLGKNKVKIKMSYLAVFTILGLALSIAETYFTIAFKNEFTGLGIKIGAFAYSLAIIMMLFSFDLNYKSDSIVWKTITYLGNISFGIYLLHMYFLSYLIRPLINRISIDGYFANQFVLITLTLLCCMITIVITRKISKKYTTKYLGF